MEENVSIWFGDRRKLLKVPSGKGKYRERLGYKCNSAWYLDIKFYPEPIKFMPFLYNSTFIFYLERLHHSEPATVTVKIFSKTTVHFSGEINFKTGEALKEIGKFYYAEIKYYKLDVIFLFPEGQKSENSLAKRGNISDDLLLLFHKEHLADVTLKCEDETVSAHKAVLCARSPVFEAMFSNVMQESTTNTVTIDDMDSSVFRSWICFVYGDEVKITSVDFACKLLHVAEKYQMKGLKEDCYQYLESVLSIENAVRLLDVANLYEHQFKRNVIAYIADNLSALKHSKEWCDLKSRKPALALEVYSYNEGK